MGRGNRRRTKRRENVILPILVTLTEGGSFGAIDDEGVVALLDGRCQGVVEDEAIRAELLGLGAAVAVVVLVTLLVVAVVAIIGGTLEGALGCCRACFGRNESLDQ